MAYEDDIILIYHDGLIEPELVDTIRDSVYLLLVVAAVIEFVWDEIGSFFCFYFHLEKKSRGKWKVLCMNGPPARAQILSMMIILSVEGLWQVAMFLLRKLGYIRGVLLKGR